MQVLLPIIYSVLFCFIIYKSKFFDEALLSKKITISLFIFKIGIGILVSWVYTYYYTENDFQKYFSDSNTLYTLLLNDSEHFLEVVLNGDKQKELLSWTGSFQDVNYNDSRTVILLNVFIRLFSGGAVLVHVIVFCFLSFLGTYALYKSFAKYLVADKKKFLILLFFIPTVLFWSSGIFKESILLLALGLLMYASDFGLNRIKTGKQMLVVLTAIVIMLFIKPYVLLAIFPGLIINLWHTYFPKPGIVFKYVLFFGLIVLAIVSVNKLFPQKDIFKMIVNKQDKTVASAKGGVYLLGKNYFIAVDYHSKEEYLVPTKKDSVFLIKQRAAYYGWELGYQDNIPFIKNANEKLFFENAVDTSAYKLVYEIAPSNSLIEPLLLEPSLGSFIKNAPAAFVRVLTLPLGEKQLKKMYYLNVLENCIFIIGLLVLLLGINKLVLIHPIVLFSFSFTLILFLLIGYTTPLIGALVRFKMPALPFLFFSILLVVKKPHFFNFKKKE